MAPKRKAEEPSHVFVLHKVSRDHGNHYQAETEVVGAFTTKAALVDFVREGKVKTQFGSVFPCKQLEDGETDDDDLRCAVWNILDPPDNGTLIEAEAGGEGDKDELVITRVPLVKGESGAAKKAKK